MSKVDERLHLAAAEARHAGRKLAGFFLTNGFPDPQSNRKIFDVIAESGADFIEIGMPFSDPLAEGPTIQHSSAHALKHGVRMRDTFGTAESIRSRHETPVYLMGYANPIHRYGIAAFFRDAASAGVDGVILPDLPPGVSDGLEEIAADAGVGIVNLIAPNTSNERIEEIDRATTSFVYAVSIAGLTGTEISSEDVVSQYLKRARAHVSNPLLVGFGIQTRASAEILSRHTDGFIVGSALIREIDAAWNDTALSESKRLSRVAEFIRALALPAETTA